MLRLALLTVALLALVLPTAQAGRVPPALAPPEPAARPEAPAAPDPAPTHCTASPNGQVSLCADRTSAPFGQGVILTAHAGGASDAPDGTFLYVWGSATPGGPTRFTGRCYTYRGGCTFVPTYVTLTAAPVTFYAYAAAGQTGPLTITWT